MSVKRNLTSDEIAYILDFIKPTKGIPEEVAMSIVKKNYSRLEQQLKGVSIYPEMIPKLKENIYHQYYTTICAPGESVGIITAQSIGERQTQNTLNTFHNTGLVVKTVVTGVPRFSELMNATRDPKAPSCTVYFKEANDSIAELKKTVNHSIKEIKFGELISKYECGKNLPVQDWYEDYCEIYNDDFKKYEWSINIQLNTEMLFDYRIPLDKIASKISSEYADLVCIFSPDHKGIISVFVDVSEITDEEELYDDEDEMYLAHLEEIALQSLKNIQLFGITGIKNIFYQKIKDEWVIDTEGSNFKEILAHPKVDKVRTISNNMWEIYDTLGIEAARNFLINEFASVVSSDGTFVNDSHIMLLVDTMTFSGSIISISRYGMKKENCGPMAKASFEESLDNFLKAGAYGEKETTNGVSASIMLGKLSKFGTGICDVLVDITKLPDKPVVVEQVVEKQSVVYEKRPINDVLKEKTEKKLSKKIDIYGSTKVETPAIKKDDSKKIKTTESKLESLLKLKSKK
jgi:DNA-directed RNA polymerase beta' subunit